MRSPGGGVLGMALPVRAMLQRLGFALLVATAFALMLLGRIDNAIVEQTRLAIVDFVTPIMDAVSRPAAALNRAAIEPPIQLAPGSPFIQPATLSWLPLTTSTRIGSITSWVTAKVSSIRISMN